MSFIAHDKLMGEIMTNHNENNNNPDEKKSSSESHKVSNLPNMSESNINNKTSDLNAKLRSIETDIKHLNAREAATNKAFRELLSTTRSHGENQDEQLDETRRAMATIKDQYKKLSQDYQRLVASSNIITVTLDQLRSQIASDLDSIISTTEERDDELANNHLQLVERANRIETKATQSTTDLDAKINVIRTTISSVERKLAAEIKEVAIQSEQRDEALSIRTNMIEEEFQEQTNALQQQSNALSNRSSHLENRSQTLEDTSARHSLSLKNINSNVERHRKGFAVAMTFIVITLGLLSLFHNNHWLESGETDIALQDQISKQIIQGAQQSENIQSLTVTDKSTADSIAILKESIDALKNTTENNASRVNAMSPYRSFGLDNTIHNAQWLAQQDQEQYVIEVTSAESKQDLYNHVYRWSNSFNKSNLSMIEQQQDGKTVFTLIYGTFADLKEVEYISRGLPTVNYNYRPTAKKLAELL